MNNLRILRLDEVVQKTGLSKNTIYNRMRKGEFPKNFRIGGCAKTVGWLEGEIDEYVKSHVPWFVVEGPQTDRGSHADSIGQALNDD